MVRDFMPSCANVLALRLAPLRPKAFPFFNHPLTATKLVNLDCLAFFPLSNGLYQELWINLVAAMRRVLV